MVGLQELAGLLVASLAVAAKAQVLQLPLQRLQSQPLPQEGVLLAEEGLQAVDFRSLSSPQEARISTAAVGEGASPLADAVAAPLGDVVVGVARLRASAQPVELAAEPMPAWLAEVRALRRARLRNQHNMIYVIDARVGTPPVSVRLIVDTGSSDLWVKRQSDGGAAGGLWYSVNESSSASALPQGRVLLQYGQGEISGLEVRDRVCLDGLCVSNQSFVLAELVKDLGGGSLFDGLLGLAYPALAVDRSGATFLQELEAHGHFGRLAFGLSLGPFGAAGRGSSLAFGSVGDLERAARASGLGPGYDLRLWGFNSEAFYWMVQASVSVAAASADAPGFACTALTTLDSGTSLLVAPQPVFSEVLGSLFPTARERSSLLQAPDGSFVCPCDARLGSLAFRFASRDGRELNITLTSEDLLEYLGTLSTGQRLCRVGLMPGPSNIPMWILGDIFLRRVYAVHDFEGHSVVLYPQPAVAPGAQPRGRAARPS